MWEPPPAHLSVVHCNTPATHLQHTRNTPATHYTLFLCVCVEDSCTSRCRALQHTCNTTATLLQHIVRDGTSRCCDAVLTTLQCSKAQRDIRRRAATYRNILQHTATRCYAVQHTVRHCYAVIVHHTLIHYDTLWQHQHIQATLQHTSLQQTATDCNRLQHTCISRRRCCVEVEYSVRCILQHTAIHCNTLQHTATHCNTLQHTCISRRRCCVEI